MRFRFLLILLAAIPAAACDDNLNLVPWDATPDTVALYTISRTDYIGLPSGYDMANLRIVVVEDPATTGNWDFVLSGTTQLELIPAPAFEGQAALRAAIAPISGTSFEALKEAPSDTALFTRQAVPIREGGVYVIRTRRVACGFGQAVHYGKIQVVSIDPARGTARFAVVLNPYCNDRSFVPPK